MTMRRALALGFGSAFVTGSGSANSIGSGSAGGVTGSSRITVLFLGALSSEPLGLPRLFFDLNV